MSQRRRILGESSPYEHILLSDGSTGTALGVLNNPRSSLALRGTAQHHTGPHHKYNLHLNTVSIFQAG